MKIFHFNDDWFNADAIGRIHKHNIAFGETPYKITVTYKHIQSEVVYSFKGKIERDNNYTTLVSNWRHACME